MHLRPHARFGVAQVFAVELEEDRGVGHCHVGFEHEDVELLTGLVNGGDDALMRLLLDGEVPEAIAIS